MISHKHSFAVIRAQGLDDTVLATFKTMEKAKAYVIDRGGDVDSICADRSLSIVSLEQYELIEIFGKYTIRLKMVSA